MIAGAKSLRPHASIGIDPIQKDTTTESSRRSEDADLFSQLRPILADRLFVQLEEVKPDSLLINDLQVDSLDFVDLQYALEERFEIRFGHGEFFEPTPQWVEKDGSLKPSAIERMASIMPEIESLAERGPISVKTFFELVSVDTLVRLIAKQLNGGDERSPDKTSHESAS